MNGPERLSAAAWAALLLDAGTVRPLATEHEVHDPLGWPGYTERQQVLGRQSVSVARGRCGDHPLVLLAFDFEVLGGSMGTAAGRRLRAGYDHARKLRLPVVLLTSSGGARMQEGMRSLVQMPGVIAAAADHADAGLLQVAVAAHPTTGGVGASAFSVADLRIAEEGAHVAFAGPRVAAALGAGGDAVRPDDRAGDVQALRAAGQLDAVLPRAELAAWLAHVLRVAAPDRPADSAGSADSADSADTTSGQGRPWDSSAWEAVRRTRDAARPRASDLVAAMDGAVVLSGDRAGGVDPHTLVALARLDGRRLLVVGQDHGPVSPAGFRTAQRGIALAVRLGLPVLTLIDTRGAAVGPAADAAGQSGAIAGTIRSLLAAATPTLGIVVGEGGSGGAMALAATDRLLMQETATFSVIAPEGAAAILHHDAGRAPEVADRLGLRSADLVRLGIVDGVVPDGVGGTLAAVRRWLAGQPTASVSDRRRRWRTIADGIPTEGQAPRD